MIDTKAIKAAAEKATPGEWLVADNGHIYSAALNLLAVAQHCRDKDANAKHIATANPAAVIALYDEIERLRKDAARYKKLVAMEFDLVEPITIWHYLRNPDDLDAAMEAKP